MRERIKREQPAALSAILEKVLCDMGATAAPGLQQLWQCWPRATGPLVSANTRPTAFKNGVVFVNVESAVWMQELFYMKKTLIEKVNAHLDKALVEDIRFRVGPL